jgi:hypothetical protein
MVKAEATHLNRTKESAVTCLHKLRIDCIGGLLVVKSLVDDMGEASIPFITLLSTPSVARYNAMRGDPGIILEDIWDGKVLAVPDLEMKEIHCPLMGAHEGFLHAKAFKIPNHSCFQLVNWLAHRWRKMEQAIYV